MRINVNAGISRRTAVAGVAALAAGTAGVVAARQREQEEDGVITVRGESPADTNIPTAEDPRASGGAHLALATAGLPPDERGWFARYRVDVPAGGGIYRLTAVVTAPMELPGIEETGSYFGLTVNDGPTVPIARSQPYWYESPPAWGGLARCELGDVELSGGRNTLTFTVEEPTALGDGRLGYRFLLDEFTLAPVALALREISLGDPAAGLGVCRPGDGEPAELRFRLNGRARTAQLIRYRVRDHRSAHATSGTVTIPAGDTTATVPLPPRLPPGNYRVTADGVPGYVAHFARLPPRRAADGAASRFGVNAHTFALVPPARLPALAAGMKAMGVGWVRDGSSWPAAQPEPGGPYDSGRFDGVIRTFQEHGLRVLEVVSPPPEWALTETSVPLPADLRDAYRYARHRTVSDALQLSNEPDVDDTASTGDQHAAYVKAAALGARTLVVLPGIAQGGVFQELMLRNEVVRYADVWSFHGYPLPGDDPEFPSAAEDQQELREAVGAAATPMWMTESGAFLPAEPGVDLTFERQLTQARYLMLSTVESLATGTDRQFWFCEPPCTDDGVSFALLSRDFQPWPAYSAYAALTALLGEAHFVRVVAELLPHAAGFVFGDGAGRTVTVVYAPGRRRVEVPVPGARRVEVYDIVGAHRAPSPRPGAAPCAHAPPVTRSTWSPTRPRRPPAAAPRPPAARSPPPNTSC